jgi:hypothetical protein
MIMAKIVHIGKGAGIRQLIAELQRMVDNDELVTMAAAIKMKDGTVATAYHADFGERGELIGHMQADFCMQMVADNLEEV